MTLRKTAIVSFAFILSVGLVLKPSFIYTESVSPSPGYTGAPGEGTCGASGCHTGNSENLDPNKLTISSTATPSLSNGYVPGTTYNISVGMGTVQSQSKGFLFTAVDANGNGAGTLTLASATTTSKITQGNREYIGHKNANSTSAWVFKWQAPAVNIGKVTFYATGIGANGDNQASGDVVYRARAEVTTSSFTQLNLTGLAPISADEAGMKIFPNPFLDRINIEYRVKDENLVTIELFTLQGKKIQQLHQGYELPGSYARSLKLTKAVAAGLYALRIAEGEQVYFKKLFAE